MRIGAANLQRQVRSIVRRAEKQACRAQYAADTGHRPEIGIRAQDRAQDARDAQSDGDFPQRDERSRSSTTADPLHGAAQKPHCRRMSLAEAAAYRKCLPDSQSSLRSSLPVRRHRRNTANPIALAGTKSPRHRPSGFDLGLGCHSLPDPATARVAIEWAMAHSQQNATCNCRLASPPRYGFTATFFSPSFASPRKTRA